MLVNANEINLKQNELNNLLKELAKCKDDKTFKDLSIKICDIYKVEFRHSYSSFFPNVINEIGKEDDGKEALELLANNLQSLYNYSITLGNKSLSDSIFKLNDHINLEIARYNTFTSNQEQIKDLEKQNKSTINALNDASSKLDDSTKKLQSVQTELIAVLSIFSAIVVTFSGSMSFIGGALQGMEKAPFAKSIFFISLCGFVLFNLVYLMMYLVAKITERNIYARCKTPDCSCESTCWGINKIRKRLPYVFWTNVALLIILFISFCANIVPICINNIIFFF